MLTKTDKYRGMTIWRHKENGIYQPRNSWGCQKWGTPWNCQDAGFLCVCLHCCSLHAPQHTFVSFTSHFPTFLWVRFWFSESLGTHCKWFLLIFHWLYVAFPQEGFACLNFICEGALSTSEDKFNMNSKYNYSSETLCRKVFWSTEGN